MADVEFELLTRHADWAYVRHPSDPYTLVHDVIPPIANDDDEEENDSPTWSPIGNEKKIKESNRDLSFECDVTYANCPGPPERSSSISNSPKKGQKARRRLPEIPRSQIKAKKISLADELEAVLNTENQQTDGDEGLICPQFAIGGRIRRPNDLFQSIFPNETVTASFGCSPSPAHNFQDYGGDIDSGNSTAHSPDLPVNGPSSSISLQCQDSPGSWSDEQLELLEPTHRGLHRFVPRHDDEVLIDIGDPIYVEKEDDDLWCEGTNLRTGLRGIFPAAHVVDVDYSEFGSSTLGTWCGGDVTEASRRRERFLLGYLGSVEARASRGDHVIMHAVSRCLTGNLQPRPTILEVTDNGLRMQDRRKQLVQSDVYDGAMSTPHDYWYAIKNVSWCSYHPRDPRYLGFITRHPRHPMCGKFACHVFQGNNSTRPVAEAIGRALQRFFHQFMDTAFPLEDIYLE